LPGKENSIISSDASGLGITLIREFIQKLNGSVEYLSEGDKVSTIVTLPSS
jgi:nitrogen-specific signal transduction histidine kinase